MRKLLLVCLLICSSHPLFAAPDLSALDPGLQRLYQRLVAGEALAGKTFRERLTLRLASDKALLFHDGYIRVDPQTRYSFLKFDRATLGAMALEEGREVTVHFRIREGRNDATTPGMPYLYVELLEMRAVE